MNKTAVANELMKIAKELASAETVATKWGFDLTEFGNIPARFVKVLAAVGISSSQQPGRGHIGEYIWKGSGIIIVTGNNPITGEYSQPERRQSEVGYASSIGIEGEPEKVAMAVQAVRKNATFIKGQSKGERRFI